jgi:hypothetical protein
MVFHEVFELTLVMPWAKPTALPDGRAGWGRRSKNYTRWFRDGFSTYAAYLVLLDIAERSGGRWPAGGPLGQVLYGNPFTALATSRDRLFGWHQFSSEGDNALNYSASFGLFLAIEERFGRRAVREIVGRIGELEFPDGAAITAVCGEVLGVDLRGWAAAYEFPPLAFEVSVVLQQSGDALSVRVDGTRVRTPFDFELAVERARSRGRSPEVVLEGGNPPARAALRL